MTTKEAADYTGLSDRHIRKLITDGEIPAEEEQEQRGKVIWLNAADLDAFKARRAEEAEARARLEKRPRGRPPKVPGARPPTDLPAE